MLLAGGVLQSCMSLFAATSKSRWSAIHFLVGDETPSRRGRSEFPDCCLRSTTMTVRGISIAYPGPFKVRPSQEARWPSTNWSACLASRKNIRGGDVAALAGHVHRVRHSGRHGRGFRWLERGHTTSRWRLGC